jgi:hypothetical protein
MPVRGSERVGMGVSSRALRKDSLSPEASTRIKVFEESKQIGTLASRAPDKGLPA